MSNNFIFTKENLIENIDKLGAWSSYGLASFALKRYFPSEYNEHGYCEVSREVDLLTEMGLEYWHDLVIKFHTEVGYDTLDPLFVNDK